MTLSSIFDKAKEKIASVDLNQVRDDALEKVSNVDLGKIGDSVKEKADKFDFNETSEKIKSTAKTASEKAKNVVELVTDKAKDTVDEINLSSLRASLPTVTFDDLKEKVQSLDTAMAKSNAVVACCVAVAAGVGVISSDENKKIKDSASLNKLQKTMIITVGNIYGIDVDYILEINNLVINKLDITSKIGKSFVAKLSEIDILEDEKPFIDAIVAGTITFVVGELSILVFKKVKSGELNIEDNDLLQSITNIYDGIGSKRLKKIFKALDEKDPSQIIDSLVDILSDKANAALEIEAKKE